MDKFDEVEHHFANSIVSKVLFDFSIFSSHSIGHTKGYNFVVVGHSNYQLN